MSWSITSSFWRWCCGRRGGELSYYSGGFWGIFAFVWLRLVPIVGKYGAAVWRIASAMSSAVDFACLCLVLVCLIRWGFGLFCFMQHKGVRFNSVFFATFVSPSVFSSEFCFWIASLYLGQPFTVPVNFVANLALDYCFSCFGRWRIVFGQADLVVY